ncbi:hypothetical protein ACFX2J_018383 [Malus domestica]
MCLTLSWNATAANGPMFVEVVLVKHQTTKPFLELYQRRCLVTMQNLWIHARLKGWASSGDDGSSSWFVFLGLHSFVSVSQKGPRK